MQEKNKTKIIFFCKKKEPVGRPALEFLYKNPSPQHKDYLLLFLLNMAKAPVHSSVMVAGSGTAL
jgi:hypothetical protein